MKQREDFLKRKNAQLLYANSGQKNVISRPTISSFSSFVSIASGKRLPQPKFTRGYKRCNARRYLFLSTPSSSPIHFHVMCIMKTTRHKSVFPLFVSTCLSGDCSDYFWLKPDQEKFLFLRLCIYKTTNYWNIFSKKVISVIH